MNRINPISKKNVHIEDNFFTFYTNLVRETILPYQWEALNDRIPDAAPSGAVKNYRIAAGLEQGSFSGLVFQDSDLAKWLEAVGHSLATHPDEELEKTADEIINLIEKAQCPDGYLDTYYSINKDKVRWSNLCECHELYCAGHMMEAAVAYYEATGKDKLLKMMCRFADHIDSVFGPEENKVKGYPGHEEIELALVKLFRATGNQKYLKLSNFFVDERGNTPNYFSWEWEHKRKRISHWNDMPVPTPNLSYNQAHQPVREQATAVGHAVRAVYLYSGMADVALETGDQSLFAACKQLWNDIITRQMYITGGIGSTHHGEAFSFGYDLPNDTVYAETCASIGLIFFAHRMQKIEISSEYADVIEKILYNLIPGSISRSGKEFFYVNPLEVWPEACEKNPGKHHVKPVRQKWFGCACCPPNIARLLASLGDYIYSIDQNSLFVHLYIGGEIDANFPDGSVTIRQQSQFPNQGEVRFTVSSKKPVHFTLNLRIPSWCRKFEMTVNGRPAEITNNTHNGYASIDRIWNDGDTISLDMAMKAEFIVSNPKVRENAGKVCLMRGPLVYCLEEVDNGENLSAIALSMKDGLSEGTDKNFPDGTIILKGNGAKTDELAWGEALYNSAGAVRVKPVTIKAIPYYLWGNRSYGEMQVWIRTLDLFQS